ncbi:hypothetical protein GQF61_13915 [Sphingobacterium sp. DK4209]|uniref:HTH LytTR-type domain-containing protein n=1 Tax=Sphingobacterium zhuxiongii TaxID=2662364 RepID=A0A5Q0QH11_9SPHI|nr:MULTISPECIES: LytTR family DNA-binding domain-containing protein [unclassified Sphingobacterium]MVZ66952.1 hypothetical protein [Sphingobacterium sp. DK4209]QGA26630.1 hypothetical protein GFH32_09960 [Sphingobacterium sp. dk4302]
MNSIFIRGSRRNEFIRVDLDKIVFVEGMSNYVKIYLTDQVLITYSTLKNLEHRLQEDSHFLRVSRSAIVNLRYVLSIYSGTITLLNGNKLALGNSYRADVYAMVQAKLVNH